MRPKSKLLDTNPRPSPSCSRTLWAKLSSQAARKDRCQQLHLEFFVSNSPKDPSAPTSRYCWEAEPRRTQLCEEASGCECSAPNQHVGVCHPTHFVKLQWPCPHHSDTWHTSSTASRTDWVLSVFFVFSPEALLRWAGIAITFCPFLPISGLSFVHPKISPLWHLHI